MRICDVGDIFMIMLVKRDQEILTAESGGFTLFFLCAGRNEIDILTFTSGLAAHYRFPVMHTC